MKRKLVEKQCDEKIVEEILRTLPYRFDHIVVAIKAAKDLDSLKV